MVAGGIPAADTAKPPIAARSPPHLASFPMPSPTAPAPAPWSAPTTRDQAPQLALGNTRPSP